MRHIFKAFTAFIHRLQRRSLDTRPHTETDQEVKDNLKLRIRICSSGTLFVTSILYLFFILILCFLGGSSRGSMGNIEVEPGSGGGGDGGAGEKVKEVVRESYGKGRDKVGDSAESAAKIEGISEKELFRR
ncbi:hypothetical protein DVH24_000619 [Malus domestica]|uniref:Uncharacterized protein n=1 Tax=Malus domestica TaxID=3750 RepID=A0A498J0I8_MALDO|nr:hypothetical protein DVH24_000619 [Malus domestica]